MNVQIPRLCSVHVETAPSWDIGADSKPAINICSHNILVVQARVPMVGAASEDLLGAIDRLVASLEEWRGALVGKPKVDDPVAKSLFGVSVGLTDTEEFDDAL